MSKIAEGELAIRVTSEDGLSGGLGRHKKGAVLRGLSQAAFNTITMGGLGEAVPAGTEVRNASEAAEAPAGSGATGKTK
jgi:hypothetical protein